MARLPRYYAPGIVQHVIQRGNNRQDIFLNDEDCAFFWECLKDAAQKYECAVHAYIFMPNHIHLLVTPKKENSVSKMLQSLGRKYVQYFNQTYERTGTLWEGRYRSTVIEPDEYLFDVSKYIELNPVRHGLVSHPRDYLWSSYHANADAEDDELVTPHANYLALGKTAAKRRAAYRTLFRKRLTDAALETIRAATNKAWALGNERFRKKVESVSGRRASPLPKGRPQSEPKAKSRKA